MAVVDAMTEADLPRLRDARRQAREESWRRGAAPSEIVLDFDATPVTAHSEKRNAAPTFKRGFGFHPLTCYLDESGEALAAKLRCRQRRLQHRHRPCRGLGDGNGAVAEERLGDGHPGPCR